MIAKPRHHLGVKYKASQKLRKTVTTRPCPKCATLMTVLDVPPGVNIEKYLCPFCGFRTNHLGEAQ